jgi:hypothetical protein
VRFAGLEFKVPAATPSVRRIAVFSRAAPGGRLSLWIALSPFSRASDMLSRRGGSVRSEFKHPRCLPAPATYTQAAASRKKLPNYRRSLSGSAVSTIVPMAGPGCVRGRHNDADEEKQAEVDTRYPGVMQHSLDNNAPATPAVSR